MSSIYIDTKKKKLIFNTIFSRNSPIVKKQIICYVIHATIKLGRILIMKKICTILFITLLAFTLVPYVHIHNGECGYNPITNSDCKYKDEYYGD